MHLHVATCHQNYAFWSEKRDLSLISSTGDNRASCIAKVGQAHGHVRHEALHLFLAGAMQSVQLTHLCTPLPGLPV